jgi:predicted Rossmann-fold nucleotide-binding protein
MALDIATGQCNKIFVANGGIKALHRTLQYLCWIQTGKLKDTELIVIDPHKRFMKAFKAMCQQSENFGCTKRSERGFIQIFNSREEAVAAGHVELAS